MKRTLLTSVMVVVLAASAAATAAFAKSPAGNRPPHRLPPHEGIATPVDQPANLVFAWSVPEGFDQLNRLLALGNFYPSMAWL